MWSPVLFVLLVASVRADADAESKPVADADAEPFIPYSYPQYNYGNNWAAIQFGNPQEVVEVKGFQEQEEDDAIYSPNVNFLPAVVAPSPFLAIRDVQVRPASVFHRPAQFFQSPLVLQTSHVRVPDHKKKAPVPKPVTASLTPSFGSQHTAQIPFYVQRPSIPSFIPVPVAAPSYSIQHTAQIPIFSNAIRQTVDDDDDDDDDVKHINFILVPHFPTELASLTSLRDLGEDPVIPAGIVQSTQPTFKPIEFKNSKAHPSLLSTLHDTSSDSVVSV